MVRPKKEDENIRTLTKFAYGKSYGITLPKDTLRAFGWEEHQKLDLTIDAKKQRIIITEKKS
jgi:hypothetical protein